MSILISFIAGITVSGLVSYILALLTYNTFKHISIMSWIYIFVLSVGSSSIVLYFMENLLN